MREVAKPIRSSTTVNAVVRLLRLRYPSKTPSDACIIDASDVAYSGTHKAEDEPLNDVLSLRMNWDALSAIAEIVGAIAVVISLIYLAVQIRQSNILSNFETRREIVRADQQLLSKIVDFPEIFDATVKDDISREQKVRLQEWLAIFMRNREFDWRQWRDGLIDDETFDSYKLTISALLTVPRNGRWWKVFKGVFSPDFVQFADRLVESSEPIDLFTEFEQW